MVTTNAVAVVPPIDLVTLTQEEYADLLAAKADRDTVERDARDAMHMLWTIVKLAGGTVRINQDEHALTNWRKVSLTTWVEYEHNVLVVKAVGL